MKITEGYKIYELFWAIMINHNDNEWFTYRTEKKIMEKKLFFNDNKGQHDHMFLYINQSHDIIINIIAIDNDQ